MAIGDTVKEYINIPSLSGVTTIILIFVIFIVIAVLIAVIGYIIFMRRKFNKKIIIFTKVGKTIEPSIRDTATEMKLNNAGDTFFYLRKTKKKLPTARIQTGRNTYWFYVRSDGEYINFGIEDIDLVMRKMNVNFLDKEMRYARSALQKNLQDRYQKESWWKEYGPFIMYAIFIVVIGIMIYLNYDKMIQLSGNQAAITKNLDEITQTIANLLQMAQGGQSGLKPASLILSLFV